MTTVTMVLAMGPGRPEGDLEDRMVLHVDLTPPGYLDAAAWQEGSTPWHTTRTRNGDLVRSGELVKIEAGWALRELGSEDEPLYSFRPNIIRPGEAVSVSRLDGDEMVYRIVAVE